MCVWGSNQPSHSATSDIVLIVILKLYVSDKNILL